MKYSYLDISTSHVSEETMNGYLKEQGNITGFTVAPYKYGCFVSVPPLTDTYVDNIPIDLRMVFAYAQGADCYVIRFDADADHIDGLPVFNW